MTTDLYLHNDPRFDKAQAPFFNHEYITYFSVIAQEWLMELDRVQVQNNPNYEDRLSGPDHVDLYKEKFTLARDINLIEAQDCSIRNGDFSREPPLSQKIEPWKILVFYCTEPDLLLDCGLDLHWSQKMTKGSHGLRHMQFNLLGKRYGLLTESFTYYYNASKKAFKDGNTYWGWRFLSRATHYLADFGHPFHVKGILFNDIIKILFNRERLYQMLAASHNGHEVFTQFRFRNNYGLFKRVIMNGALLGAESKKDLFKEMKSYIKHTKKNYKFIYNTILNYFGQDFIDLYKKMDDYPDMDSSKQVLYLQLKVQESLFSDSSNEGLKILDKVTAELLRETGYMLGLMLSQFRSIIKKVDQWLH